MTGVPQVPQFPERVGGITAVFFNLIVVGRGRTVNCCKRFALLGLFVFYKAAAILMSMVCTTPTLDSTSGYPTAVRASFWSHTSASSPLRFSFP
jgi:hypothetical protein